MRNPLGGVSAARINSFYYYSYTAGLDEHIGKWVQGPDPNELSPYQLVTIQFKVIRSVHSLLSPLAPQSIVTY